MKCIIIYIWAEARVEKKVALVWWSKIMAKVNSWMTVSCSQHKRKEVTNIYRRDRRYVRQPLTTSLATAANGCHTHHTSVCFVSAYIERDRLAIEAMNIRHFFAFGNTCLIINVSKIQQFFAHIYMISYYWPTGDELRRIKPMSSFNSLSIDFTLRQ